MKKRPAPQRHRPLFYSLFFLYPHHIRGDLGQRMRTAHLHGVGQLTGQLINVALHTFLAAAIVVSNHGGRVLDQCPATAEVLPEIAAALKGTGVKVLVDGGIRTGVDVFKALALGADGVLICRPFVTAVYGGGAEGVKCYIDKLAGELADTMQMCGAHSIEEITREMVRV